MNRPQIIALLMALTLGPAPTWLPSDRRLSAQETRAVGGNAPQIEEARARAKAEAEKRVREGQPQNQPASNSPGDKSAAKPEEAQGDKDKKEGGEDKTVTRESKPPAEPDPSELQVQPDEEGKLQFQFRNQPWPDVLRWLADVAKLSLDWQELPNDYINLATQRPHTLQETMDMINRALLTRGFTILTNENVLIVAKIESLNPAMVPRVDPAELSDLPPHMFARTSFPLTWLLAEEVHEEFQSMISPNGKLTPLVATNRLEGMDAVANLRDIHDILQQEQSSVALENLAREFPLEHARASVVKQQLEVFLGINSSGGGGGGPMDPNAMRMIQQQMQQMQQQMQQAARNNQGGGSGGSTRAQRPEDVYLVANDRSNSVIVHAQPDKMAIIASFISRIDVPNEHSADYQRLGTRMKVFRLASLGPAELVASLSAMDVLEPRTQLQVDEKNNAIIAYASIADQYLIQSVIDRLDGSERSFEVIPLRRLDAESVAGTIKFLMGAEEEEDSNSNRRSYYSYYDYYSRGQQNDKKSDKMRVGANVQDNQLLLWANSIEMEEVENLLVKLGEIPPAGGSRGTVRVIDASRQPETYEYLQRLKEQWDRVSPNPLVLPDAEAFQRADPLKPGDGKDPDEASPEGEAAPDDDPAEALTPAKDKLTAAKESGRERWTSAPAGERAE